MKCRGGSKSASRAEPEVRLINYTARRRENNEDKDAPGAEKRFATEKPKGAQTLNSNLRATGAI
ncbi:hypothetical protein GW17_00020925 [Ensete ventricosum]|nr:hypothetical protein GW17_00020925 [Ensete ventricosum]